MHGVIFFVVALIASFIGSICGIGGGIVIKPLLDSLGKLDVETTSFLSGCTVLSMSAASVCFAMLRGREGIVFRTGTPLAFGAVAGGAVGQRAFHLSAEAFGSEAAGAFQSALLVLTLLAALLYTWNEGRIETHRVRSTAVCFLAGGALGVLSAFVGIGGGPVNLVLFSFLFSMDTKSAAANSLYVILFSQFAGTLFAFLSGSVPPFEVRTLSLMIFGGIGGAFLGRSVNRRMRVATVRRLFILLMVAVICIGGYNACRLSFEATGSGQSHPPKRAPYDHSARHQALSVVKDQVLAGCGCEERFLEDDAHPGTLRSLNQAPGGNALRSNLARQHRTLRVGVRRQYVDVLGVHRLGHGRFPVADYQRVAFRQDVRHEERFLRSDAESSPLSDRVMGDPIV